MALPSGPSSSPAPAPAPTTPVAPTGTPVAAPAVTPPHATPAVAPAAVPAAHVAAPAATPPHTPPVAPHTPPAAPLAPATPTSHRNWTRAAIAAALLAIAGGVAYVEHVRGEANDAEMARARAAILRQLNRYEGIEALKPTISVTITAQRVGNKAVLSLKNPELTVDGCGETHPAVLSVVGTEMAGNGVLKTTFEVVVTAHGRQQFKYEGIVMAGRVRADVQATADLVE